jgi:hypothetical protein
MPLTSRVTSILPEPNEDGDNVIGIKLGDGSAFDVAIDLGAAQKLVEILQRRLVRWASESAKSLSLPQYDVTDAAIAHRGPEVALILTTTQNGTSGVSDAKRAREKSPSGNRACCDIRFWLQS